MREPSLGELVDDFREMKADLKEGLRQINDKLATFEQTHVRRDLYEARHAFVLEKLAALEVRFDDTTRRLEALIEQNSQRVSRVGWAAITGIVFPIIVIVIVAVLTSGVLSK